MEFKPRLEKPEAGNPFYNTKAKGGYSTAIQGSPTDPGCNVLANCVGYCFGRFNEISNNTSMSYLSPRNAEVFWDIAEQQGLKRGNTPKVGSVIVWQRGDTRNPDGKDGAGHVAIVEEVISDTEIVTSESGYGSTRPFWTTKRKFGSGNWGMGGNYKFLGFIYHPDLDNEVPVMKPEFLKIQDGTQVYECRGALPEIKKGVVVSPTGVYTIVEKKTFTINEDRKQVYGKLKSGIGWVLMSEAYIEHKLGSIGIGVKRMKLMLSEAGYLPEIAATTSDFDRCTLSAVCGFQFENGLTVTGTYNVETRKKLEGGA